MSNIEDSLLQLQRRIAEARRGSADSSRDAHIAELTQRFAELEAQMFSEHSMRREAHAIHQRTQRRRKQQQREQQEEQREQQEEEQEEEEQEQEPSEPKDSPFFPPRGRAHSFLRAVDLCGGAGAQQRSFSRALAGDDRPRLLFVIDELSRVLREERARGDALQQRIVPKLIRHVEALERDAAEQRREIAALRRELALQFELSRLVEAASEESDSQSRSRAKKGSMEKRIEAIVSRCEQQLRQYKTQELVK